TAPQSSAEPPRSPAHSPEPDVVRIADRRPPAKTAPWLRAARRDREPASPPSEKRPARRDRGTRNPARGCNTPPGDREPLDIRPPTEQRAVLLHGRQQCWSVIRPRG